MYRKKFQYFQLLQIPLSFLFGYFTDFGLWCVSFLQIESYWAKFLMTVTGTIVLGFGVSLSVIANVIMNSGEAFVKAVSDFIHKDFSTVKIVFDVSCVVLSVLLSLFFFFGKIFGTREGTLVAAFCTGIAVKIFLYCFSRPLEYFLTR